MKIKVIAIITVIIILLLKVPVYADTVIPDPPSDVWEYWVILEHSLYDFWCLCSNTPIKAETDGSKLVIGYYKYYRYEDNEWRLSSSGDNERFRIGEIYQSNHDIAYEDGSGFFFLRPRVSPLTQGMKGTDFGTIWKTFSVGLIPIIGCLILVISLRKGWEFLQTQLKH